MKNRSSLDADKTESTPANDLNIPDKLVDATRLLTILWDVDSRPSLRWLREQQARRAIPFIKIGAKVWFDPIIVRQHFMTKWIVKHR